MAKQHRLNYANPKNTDATPIVKVMINVKAPKAPRLLSINGTIYQRGRAIEMSQACVEKYGQLVVPYVEPAPAAEPAKK